MEPRSNVRMLCKDCAPKPKSLYREWAPAQFQDRWIKTAFSEKKTGRIEHLWIKVKTATKTQITGTVDNDPVMNLAVKFGDTVKIPISKIESVYDGKKFL